MAERLPIYEAVPDLLRAVRAAGRAVLVAPPGAGKTTVVPLELLDAVKGRIVMLEPRRLAARGAAVRMAETLGEAVGQTVGYRIRGEAKVSNATRIEVVTEGILTRMIQSDPGLEGIGAVIFDEFHERSLNADLGLALVWEVRQALREDLVVVVMSATLDAEPVAGLLDDAPVVRSMGRAFEVETRWLEAPRARRARFDADMAALIRQAADKAEGSILAFLPGEGEIRRVAAMLDGKLGFEVAPLFGAMKFEAQQAAIRPSGARKLVLATSIAETSLTIPDIRVVVDGGLARRARFDAGTGMSRLVTEKVSRAEAEQRRGRAGRVSEGVCFRLWTRGEEGGLSAFPPAEIEVADLTAMALELALWGAGEVDELAFLTMPSEGAMAEARALLGQLGALDGQGRITEHGRVLAAMPVHPRLAHMLAVAGAQAAPLAALISDRDPLRGVGVDLSLRSRALAGGPVPPEARGAIERLKQEARRLAKGLPQSPDMSAGEMAALAYPDRIGLRRPGDEPRWLLSGGRGAVMEAGDALAGARLIVATDLDGGGREARVRQAVQITEGELRGLYGAQIGWYEVCQWDRRKRRVEARRQEKFGALVLADQIWKDAPGDAMAAAAFDGLRDLGLPVSAAAARFRARVALMGEGFPDLSDAALLADGAWILPYLGKVRTEGDLKNLDLLPALRAMLDWGQMQALDQAVPASFESPLGRSVPIDYSGEVPEITVRLQEMFGVTRHPVVGAARVPLRVVLTSPAHRPIQVTTDIPGFWDSSYADVRKDMRGRYPKHPWPENPREADPTLRAKRRGT